MGRTGEVVTVLGDVDTIIQGPLGRTAEVNGVSVALSTEDYRAVSGEFALRTEDTGTYFYVGKAVPGSSTASAVWQIFRLTNADLTKVWPEGNSNFDNVWNDRATITYT